MTQFLYWMDEIPRIFHYGSLQDWIRQTLWHRYNKVSNNCSGCSRQIFCDRMSWRTWHYQNDVEQSICRLADTWDIRWIPMDIFEWCRILYDILDVRKIQLDFCIYEEIWNPTLLYKQILIHTKRYGCIYPILGGCYLILTDIEIWCCILFYIIWCCRMSPYIVWYGRISSDMVGCRLILSDMTGCCCIS